jgi:CDP-diacylglycerol---glycerol-3-phosphate 3-phosphatidyltransferase
MSIRDLIAKPIAKAGVPADVFTWLGLLSAFIAGSLILRARFFEAGMMLLFSGALDMLDGSVARASGKAGPFGGILDSSLDRYGDGFILGGAMLYFLSLGELRYGVLALSALIGSFSISYVRARAECEIDDCRVGFWERGERIVLIVIALVFHRLEACLWILGIATHWTVFQRIYMSYIRTTNARPFAPFLKRSARSEIAYYIKVGIILVILFLLPR